MKLNLVSHSRRFELAHSCSESTASNRWAIAAHPKKGELKPIHTEPEDCPSYTNWGMTVLEIQIFELP